MEGKRGKGDWVWGLDGERLWVVRMVIMLEMVQVEFWGNVGGFRQIERV